MAATTTSFLVLVAPLLLALALAQARPGSLLLGDPLIQWDLAKPTTGAVADTFVADSDLDTYSKPAAEPGKTVAVVNNFGDDDMNEDDDDDDQQQQQTATYATVYAADDDDGGATAEGGLAAAPARTPVPVPEAAPVPGPVPVPVSVPAPQPAAEPEGETSESGAAIAGSPARAIPPTDLQEDLERVHQVLVGVSSEAMDALRQLELRNQGGSPLGRCASSVLGVSQDIISSLRQLGLTPVDRLPAASVAQAGQWARQASGVQMTCASSLSRAADATPTTTNSNIDVEALGDGEEASAADAEVQRRVRSSYNTVVASVYSLARVIGLPKGSTILSDLQL